MKEGKLLRASKNDVRASASDEIGEFTVQEAKNILREQSIIAPGSHQQGDQGQEEG